MKTQTVNFVLLPLVMLLSACGSDSNNRGAAQVPQNQAPEITEIAAQAVDEDGVLGPLAFSVSDSETTAELLTIAVSTSDNSLLSADGISIEGNGEQRSLFVRPVSDASGETEITLTVTDADGANAETSFTLEVAALPREEFSSWVRTVAASPSLLDGAVGEKPESGELSEMEDVARIKFSDLSAGDSSAYDDFLPMEDEAFED